MNDTNYPFLESVFINDKSKQNNALKNKLDIISRIETNQLVEFREHIFKDISQDKFNELKESIKENGILSPIIVRQISDNHFEILSGHNRVRACRDLNINTIPAIIKNVNDNTAKLIMIDSNVSQRDKLLPSELMKAYSIKQELLRKNHFDQLDKNSEKPSKYYDTRQKLSEQEKTSASQISRYIRLKYLNQELLDWVDNDTLPFNVGVSLSFLKESHQQILLNVLQNNPDLKISLKKADILKNTKSDLTEEFIITVLKNKYFKSTKRFTGKVKSSLVRKYKDKFKSDEEFTNLLEILLKQYFDNTKNLSDKNPTN